MIICQCAVVSDRFVPQAIAAGAQTLAQVCRFTNAGRDCGACVSNVKRVITEHGRDSSRHAAEREIRRRSSTALVATSP